MKIKEVKGGFLVSSKNSKIFLSTDFSLHKSYDASICINLQDVKGECFLINKPGEYEVEQVFCMVMQKDNGKYYVVDVEGINFLLVPGGLNLSEKEIEEIGEVDIMIFVAGSELNSEVVKFVNKIDPQLVLFSKDQISYEETEKLFGLPVEKVSTRIKYNSMDFDSEEYKLRLIALED